MKCEVTRLEDEERRRRNERNCERDATERVAAKGSSIRIPRHAPSYHIDLAIVTILSSPAMLGCTVAAGGKGMSESEESREREGSEERVREREREEGRQVVPHGVPRHPTMRECGPPRIEREGERGMKRRWDEEKGGSTEAVVGGEGIRERERERRRGTKRVGK